MNELMASHVRHNANDLIKVFFVLQLWRDSANTDMHYYLFASHECEIIFLFIVRRVRIREGQNNRVWFRWCVCNKSPYIGIKHSTCSLCVSYRTHCSTRCPCRFAHMHMHEYIASSVKITMACIDLHGECVMIWVTVGPNYVQFSRPAI